MAISAVTTHSARAQNPEQEEEQASPTAVDQVAAEEATIVYRHARPAHTPAGALLRQKDLIARSQSLSTRAGNSSNTDNDQLRFPADLSYLGGTLVDSAESHNIYLLPKTNPRCASSSCWGNPEGFLKDLAGSDFVHVLDQYIRMSGSNRYTLGVNVKMKYTPSALTDADVAAQVHKIAAKTGSGYRHIYHVFLPPGQDICFTSTGGVCYSPDIPATFAFCAYHSSVTFMSDNLHVLYTVEPFQNVPGCRVRLGTHNGQLTDSTNNSLSHELFETITDPDGNGWLNFSEVILASFGSEIGDECSFFVVSPQTGNVDGDPSPITMNGHHYAVQPEYSNSEHACATSP